MTATSSPETPTNEISSYLNLAAYLFATLDKLPERKEHLDRFCATRAIKGTILLTPEGINLFVSGTRNEMDELLADLRSDPLLEKLEAKESYSDHQPHRRMLVKIKKEIIAFGIDGIAPESYTSRRVSAQTLKTWLDEKKKVHLLDTRNEFEIEVGTFHGAIRMGLGDFRSFAEAVDALPEDLARDLREQPVVTFCTGGIRCEKAAPFLEKAGFKDIYQLDGGILKYFEDVGGDHYDGDCFVFDQRVALNPALEETKTTYCFACQETLFEADQESENYVIGVSCPHCWTRAEDRVVDQLAARNLALEKWMDPLPGSAPYENHRPMRVPERLAGRSVIDFLVGLRTQMSEEGWAEAIGAQQILVCGRVSDGSEILKPGDLLTHILPGHVEPDVDGRIKVLYEDDSIVVVDKPAPLPTHPSGRFNRNTLLHALSEVYAPQKLRVVHRLDANTTGVLILARSRQAAASIQAQFSNDEIEKEYLARVIGAPPEEMFSSDAPLTDQPEKTGARRVDPKGRPAFTEFSVLERGEDGTTLLRVQPRTGRTHQIRLHLWDLGLPILGDPLYLPEEKFGESCTIAPSDPPMHLHARRIQLKHPEHGRVVAFTCEPREGFSS